MNSSHPAGMSFAHPAGSLVPIRDTRLWVEKEGQGEPLILLPGGSANSHLSFHPYFQPLPTNIKSSTTTIAVESEVIDGNIWFVDGRRNRVDLKDIGVRTTWKEQTTNGLRCDVLGHYAQLAAEGPLSIPIARTFALEDWREATEICMSKKVHGKLLLLPGAFSDGDV